MAEFLKMRSEDPNYRLARTIEKYRRLLANQVPFPMYEFIAEVQHFLTIENIASGMSSLRGPLRDGFRKWVEELPEEPMNTLDPAFPFFGGRDSKRITAELKTWFRENETNDTEGRD